MKLILEFEGSTFEDIERQFAALASSVPTLPATRSFAHTNVEPPLSGDAPTPDLSHLLNTTEEDMPTEESINPREAVLDAARRYGLKYGTRALNKLLRAHGAERARDLAEDQWVPFINATIRG